jgi:hypothetical protein
MSYSPNGLFVSPVIIGALKRFKHSPSLLKAQASLVQTTRPFPVGGALYTT